MLARRLRTLNPLRTFVVAAREGGFTAAADKLAVTHAAVSKQIGGLEQDLGARLFERSARSVRLTPQGRELHRRLEGIFSELDSAIERFDDGAPKTLTISCEPTLCARLLIPLLPLTDDGTPVQILAAGGPVDLARHGVDIAIRRNDFPLDPEVHVVPLADELTGPVASPDLLVDGVLATGRPLTAIHSRTRPDAWSAWLARTGLPHPAVKDMVLDNHLLAMSASSAGQGVAILSPYMVAEELAAGRLCAPMGFMKDGSRYVALLQAPIEADDRVAALIRRVRSRLTAIAAKHR